MNNIEFIRYLLKNNPQGLTGPEIRRALIKRNIASGRIRPVIAMRGVDRLVAENYYGWYTSAKKTNRYSWDRKVTPADRGYWVKVRGRWYLPDNVPGTKQTHEVDINLDGQVITVDGATYRLTRV